MGDFDLQHDCSSFLWRSLDLLPGVVWFLIRTFFFISFFILVRADSTS